MFRDVQGFVIISFENDNEDSGHVFFIKGQYWKDSIKSCERKRRANIESTHLTAARHEQKLPKQIKNISLLMQTRKNLLIFC